MSQYYKSIERFHKNLIPEMVDYKYFLMAKNIYSFYRGTCFIYYEDLSKSKTIPFSPLVWVCGDLHMENFGSYRGDNRLVYFDLNDFDEAVLAPASWEISRFLTSLFIAFEAMGIDDAKAFNMAKLYLKTYRQTLANGKPYYLEPQTSKGIVCTFLSAANERKHKRLLSKKTQKINGKRKIRITKKHIKIDRQLKKELFTQITNWITHNSNSLYNFEVVDVVFRIAGLGSIGLKRYLFLLKSTNIKEKYLLVDMKETRNSSLAPFLSIEQHKWTTQANRTIEIQKRMQNIPPALLSELTFKNVHYVIQEMQSAKDGINLNLIKNQYRDIYQVIDDMAMLTASAQLRSASRQNASCVDELILFGENLNWQDDILEYALEYTKKVKEDFSNFKESYRSKNRAKINI